MSNSKPKPNTQYIEHLRCRLAEALNSVKYQNGMFPSYKSFETFKVLDNVIPRGELDRLKLYVESPAIQFISFCETGRVLRELFEYEKDDTLKSLSELDPEIQEKICSSIMKAVTEIPYSYNVIGELPMVFIKGIPVGQSSFSLSETTKICKSDDEEILQYEIKRNPPSGRALLSTAFGGAIPWKANSCYLVQSMTGYCEEGYSSILNDEFKEFYKSFVGLFVALDPLAAQFTPLNVNGKFEIAYFRLTDKVQRNTHIEEFSGEETKVVNNLMADLWGTLFKNQEYARAKVEGKIRILSKVLKLSKSNSHLLNAALWYYDGLCSENRIMAFVKMSISQEILLGDKKMSDIIGVTKLLANRYAYLTGTNQSDRFDRMQKFEEVYDIRSKIVHNGKYRLSDEDEKKFGTLREICSESFSKEMQNLCGDSFATDFNLGFPHKQMK